MLCTDSSFLYPMKADIYYPIISQNSYGQVSKEWVFDRTVNISATPFTKSTPDEVSPNTYLSIDNKLSGRMGSDPRISSNKASNAITNILITNIRDRSDNIIYQETAGSRSGRGTIYELGTVEPFVGAFGSVDHYRILLRRTENQAVGD